MTLRVGSAGKEFTIHKNLACSSVDFLEAELESGFTEAGSGIKHLPEDDKEVILLLVDWIYGRTIPTGYIDALCIRSSTSTSSLTRFIESLSGDQGMWSQKIQRNWLHKPDLKDTWDIVKGDSLASVRGPRNRAIIDPRQRNEQDSRNTCQFHTHSQDVSCREAIGPIQAGFLLDVTRTADDSNKLASIAKPTAKLLGVPGWRLYDVTWVFSDIMNMNRKAMGSEPQQAEGVTSDVL
ncbi:uncharacterized protein RAG0_15342 [Rhynchosporium agropyri]|uniref:BTB domain-containing protein n=1 Tax=Rhynchosporium agropyri TaxID=914238 RepID=A0A1E1LKQ9_9HELO|nr:uncharacterized protein RAG0_15342 [Rhynchosporium agropyri]